MSRRRNKQKTSAAPPQNSVSLAVEKAGTGTDELKWTRREVHLALIVAVASGGAWLWERFWPSSRRFRPILTASVNEILLSDSRLLLMSITNNGSDPAEDVVVTIESVNPFVKLNEKSRRAHTHIAPPQSFEIAVEEKKIVVSLKGKIGAGQNVSITLDRLDALSGKPGLFQGSVAYDKGMAEMTKNVTPLPGVSSADYITALGGNLEDAIEGSK